MLIPASKLPANVAEIYPDGVDPHREYDVEPDGIIISDFLDDSKSMLDKLLDNIDLDLKWYIPSADAFKFIMFIRLVLGEEPENDNPIAHYFFIDCIFKSPNVYPYFMVRGIDYDFLKDETVVLCSREFSKSTLITYLVMFMASEGYMPGFGKVNMGLYISDSMNNGVKTTMEKIKAVYLESAYLQTMFEEVHFTQEEISMVKKPTTKKDIEAYRQCVEVEKRDKKFAIGRMKRTFTIKGKGCMTSTRGASDALFRPQFAFIDDVVANEKDAESEAILDSIESTIESDVRGGLSGSGFFIVAIGTPYNNRDPITRRINEGLMLPVVFPRAAKVPKDGMTEDEFESVWPDRHTFKICRTAYIKAKKAKENGNSYKMKKLIQEHYLRSTSNEDRMISDKMIQWYSRAELEKNLVGYNLYATTDFTTTSETGSDLAGIAGWAVSSNMDYFMLDLSLKQQGIEEQYNELFRINKRYMRLTGGMKQLLAGIEIDGQQKSHVYSVKKRMQYDNEYFGLAKQAGQTTGSEGILSRKEGGNKHWRFRNTLPIWQNRKLWLPEELKDTPDMIELLDEIKNTTLTSFNSKYDDGNDLISMLTAIDIQFPAPGSHMDYIHNSKSNTARPKLNDFWSRGQDEQERTSSAYNSYA